MAIVPGHRADLDPAPLLRQGAPECDANVRSPATVVDADTGEPVLLTVRYPGDLGAFRRAVRSYPMQSTTRAGGIRNGSRTFGFVGRNPLMKRTSCRVCAAALEAPEAHGVITDAAGALAAQLQEHLPARADQDRALVQGEVQPEWLMHPNAWWSSGIVNCTSPLPYHFDGNNFDAWSAMVVVRRGVTGGHLHLPAYGLTIACRDGDVVYFNGNSVLHGVTPMRKTVADGYRYSAVYYPVRSIRHCLPIAEELAQGARARTAAEAGLLDRQRAEGYLNGPIAEPA